MSMKALYPILSQTGLWRPEYGTARYNVALPVLFVSSGPGVREQADEDEPLTARAEACACRVHAEVHLTVAA